MASSNQDSWTWKNNHRDFIYHWCSQVMILVPQHGIFGMERLVCSHAMCNDMSLLLGGN